MTILRRMLVAIAALAALTLIPATDGMAANVELLHGTVRSVGHEAAGKAAVVLTTDKRRLLTLRSFRIVPGPQVRVYLVPRGARSDGQIPKDFKDLGRLKGSRGNQQYAVPNRVDLHRYTSVVFWCVPFTQALARANLTRS
ncbi:MAG: hypothetical protein QOJ35_3415 [Solirubrobacteraceae bacterium]|jgi:hypothetical protein|nr:hypothetical protein [Solirubrobacteraceae bacterium]